MLNEESVDPSVCYVSNDNDSTSRTIVSLEATACWCEISQSNLEEWDRRLQITTASLYQFPIWNEPYKRVHFKPRYLCYKLGDKEVAYVCILSLSLWKIRLGLIRFGPVLLNEEFSFSQTCLQKLEEWARHEGYIFLRFSHTDEQILSILKSLKNSKEVEAFPLFPEETEALTVKWRGNEQETLSSFSKTARTEIKRAINFGYEIIQSDDPKSLDQVWFLNDLMTSRKQINSRPLVYYQDMIKLATRIGVGRLYTAYLNGKAVESILVIRVAGTAYYSWGATDSIVVGNHSPSRLLHWHAMKDSFNLGMKYYHLGRRAGPVYEFKRRFHPDEISTPSPITLVLNRFLFSLYSISFMKLSAPLMVWIRRLGQAR